MTILFEKPSEIITCEQFRSITVTKESGEAVVSPIEVKCLGKTVGYEPIVDNVTGEETLILVCAEHAGDLNEI